ncbi:TPA: transporter substrate-binding domain-containing protein [Vibrio vulnificus]
MIRVILLIQFLFVGYALAHESINTKAVLTDSEIDYIIQNGEVTLGGGLSFEPFLITESDGSLAGYDVDIAQLITESTGLKIKFELGVWNDVAVRAQNREFDGLSASGDHQKRSAYFDNSKPYITLTRIVFVPKGNPKNIKSLQDLRGKTVALQNGNLIFESLLDGSKILYFDSISEMIEAVSSGQADYTIYDESIHYIGRKLGLMSTLQPVFTVGSPFNVVFALRNDQPTLKSIIDKGLSSISEEQVLQIRNKWFGDLEIESTVQLSNDELVYLSSKNQLTYCINPNLHPLEYLDEEGKHQGISRDLMSLISQKLGEPISFVKTSSWQDSLNYLVSKKCDFIPLIHDKSIVRSDINFTPVVLTRTMVVVTSQNQSYIERMDDYSDKSYAIRSEFIEASQIGYFYPNAKIISVSSVDEGLRKVKSGEVFGYIDLIDPIVYNSNMLGELNIKVSGQLPWKNKFVMAVMADNVLLHSILSKSISSITRSDINQIEVKWMATRYEKVTDYTSLFIVVIVSLIVIGIITFLYHRIRFEKVKSDLLLSDLQDAKQELEIKNKQLLHLSTTDRLTHVFNRVKLDEVMGIEITKAKQHQSALGIILVDIDHFKKVNDTYGHLIGDELLVHIATCLMNNIRPGDTLGRWGGEEFLIICPNTGQKELEVLAEQLRKTVELSRKCATPKLTISLGLTLYQADDSEKNLIRRADEALYAAKANGRNRSSFCLYDESHAG